MAQPSKERHWWDSFCRNLRQNEFTALGEIGPRMDSRGPRWTAGGLGWTAGDQDSGRGETGAEVHKPAPDSRPAQARVTRHWWWAAAAFTVSPYVDYRGEFSGRVTVGFSSVSWQPSVKVLVQYNIKSKHYRFMLNIKVLPFIISYLCRA